MKFKLDENLPTEIVQEVRAAGHQAQSVSDQGLSGATDPSLLTHVRHEGAVLLTMDKGIADIRAYPPQQYAGIVLLRPRSTGRAYVTAFARRHFPTLVRTELKARLLVVSEAGIRRR